MKFTLIIIISFLANYSYSQIDSTSKSFYPNGKLWRLADFKDGKLNGKLIYYYKNGQLMETAFFSNGKRNGEYLKYDSLGNLEFHYNYINGEMSGFQKLYYKNGNLKSEEHIKDKKNIGIQKYYYENGNLKEQFSRNRLGQYDGIFETYYENGMPKVKGQYNDQFYETGLWKYYDNKGNIVKKQHRNGLEAKTIFSTEEFIIEFWNDTTRFVFSDILVICPTSGFMYREKGESDIINIEMGMGMDIENLKFKLAGEDSIEVSFAIRKELSFGMSAEGPHIELINWKHAYSDWILMKQDGNSFFSMTDFDELPVTSIPVFTKQELEAAIEKHAGKEWVKYYNESFVGRENEMWLPAAAQLKISYINSDGKKVKKLIRFIIPMGC